MPSGLSAVGAAVPAIPAWLAQFLTAPPPEKISLMIGGIVVTVALAIVAAEHLLRSPGLMVRQPLSAIGHPLALCDYHAEAAPYRAQFYPQLSFTGKGAAGRPATKVAFIHALHVRSAQATEEARLRAAEPLLESAYGAFGSDFRYLAEMANAAVSLRARQHAWRLRSDLRDAQQLAASECDSHAGEFSCAAINPCGTGDCRYASGVYATLVSPARPGRQQRPANHADRAGYSTAAALEELERRRPFTVRAGLA